MKRAVVVLLCAALRLAAQNDESRVFEWGFEQRVRNENWNNIFDWNENLDDERAQVRYRTRLWAKVPVSSDVDFHVGLNQETNQIIQPDRPFQFDEVMFETAYVDVKKLFVDGLSLKLGRQNLMKGEGFVFLEGTPWDGSRSIYYNAAVLGYAWKKSKIEAIGIWNPRSDRFFPRIHDKHRQLGDWEERAIGAYYTDNNHKNTLLEAYYFYKKETGDLRAKTHPQYQPDRHVQTAGSRVVHNLGKGWSLHGELALQWGAQHPRTDIRGWGGYGYVRKDFKRARQFVNAGYWGMSGDDPATKSRVEGWDPLFSRWPKWSEMYIYSQFREVAPAYWTNTAMWYAEWGFQPWKRVGGKLMYYRMNAFHPFRGDPRTFGTGTVRGDQPQARIDVAVNSHWKGHILYEHHAPGDFYSYRSHGYFLRFEAIYTIGGKIPVGNGK